MQAINLAQKLSTFTEHWQPRVVGQFNGHDLMVVKVKGEFVWHKTTTQTISSLCCTGASRSACVTVKSPSVQEKSLLCPKALSTAQWQRKKRTSCLLNRRVLQTRATQQPQRHVV
jgi:hypothetical protein